MHKWVVLNTVTNQYLDFDDSRYWWVDDINEARLIDNTDETLGPNEKYIEVEVKIKAIEK